MSSDEWAAVESGAATVVGVAVVVVVMVLTLVLADIGTVLTARSRAAAAADAGALAAAPLTFQPGGDAPAEVAAAFVASNGAMLRSCVCPVDRTWRPRTVVVVVESHVDTLLAGRVSLAVSSRAEFVPVEMYVEG